jgi:hypothetical protein
MKKLLRPLALMLLTAFITTAFCTGCESEGSREYIPSKGWQKTEPD